MKIKRNCPFNYAGSKSNYPELFTIDEPLVDLFGGGGGLWSNTKSKKVLVNDLNSDLIGFQKLIYNTNRDDFECMLDKIEVLTFNIDTREKYEDMRRKFNETKNPKLFYCLLSTCTNNLIRYNLKGGFNQSWGQRKFNSSMRKKIIDFYNNIKQKDVTFMSGSFSDVPTMDDYVYFVDPPYLITNAGYNTVWGEDKEQLLYKYISDKRFILTNYIKKGDVINPFLTEFIKTKPHFIIRQGKMKSQKNDDEFIELVVFSDELLMNKIKKNILPNDK